MTYIKSFFKESFLNFTKVNVKRFGSVSEPFTVIEPVVYRQIEDVEILLD